MKTALVYDRVNKWGGAERVLLTLHEIFPDAPLFTSVYSPQDALWAKAFPYVYPSALSKVPYFRNHHEKIPFLMPLAFENVDLKSFDQVISVTSEAAKGVLTSNNTNHICYCLTPTRYLWSGYKTYFNSNIKRVVSKPVVSYLRRWDRVSASRPDLMVAISKAVRRRIKKYYNRTSQIIYPPVELSLFTPSKKIRKDKYFLVVSRLVPYKKVDLAVTTFNKLKLPLLIIGTGSDERKLKNMSGKTITFLKDVTDKDLASYYQKARGLVFPQHEDFGLTAVESLASGTAVVAYKKGGARDIIKEGKNGIFFDKQNPEALKLSIHKFLETDFNYQNLIDSASKFSKDSFKQEFSNIIQT